MTLYNSRVPRSCGAQSFRTLVRWARRSSRCKYERRSHSLSQGNVSNVKSVGGGVLEFRVDFGPEYRICFGRDSHNLVILLDGGTKRRQQQDIESALARWIDYKTRKREAR